MRPTEIFVDPINNSTMYNNSKILQKLPKLLSVRDLVKIYGLKSKHQLDQNFLLDKNITGKYK